MMRRPLILQAAILAGAGLLGQSALHAQDYGTYPSQGSYQPGGQGEFNPPLVAPSPYADAGGSAMDGTSIDGGQSYPLTVDDFPQNGGMIPDYGSMPMQQPMGGMGMPANSLATSTSPQSFAPNMIGDFFGISGGGVGRPSQLSIQTDAFRFAGSFRNGGGNLVFFPSSPAAGGFVDLTAPQNIVLNGDVSATIPAGTVWQSEDSLYSYPQSFAVDQNLVQTVETFNAFPNATDVTFVEGRATQNPNDPSQYSIYTDYIIDQPSPVMTVRIPDPGSAPGAFIGRQKISENTSPIPRTRVFANYSYFSNVPLTQQGINVSRVTPGFEWAFLDDNVSLEVRTPFASTLDNDVNLTGLTSTGEVQFGNVTAFLKALMWESDTFSWSAGVGLSLPTAQDFNVQYAGRTALRIENQAIHVLPFIGFLWTPSERLFVQGFGQVDVDANGNTVQLASFDDGLPSGGLSKIGRVNDANYGFLDLSIGYWVYRNRHCDKFINGLAPIVEVHYNAATNTNDTIRRNDFATKGANVQVGTPNNNLEVTNVTLGMNAILGNSSSLTLGYTTPVSGDDQFDGEFRAFFNWFLGPVRR